MSETFLSSGDKPLGTTGSFVVVVVWLFNAVWKLSQIGHKRDLLHPAAIASFSAAAVFYFSPFLKLVLRAEGKKESTERLSVTLQKS